MSDALAASIRIAASGLSAQSMRLQIVSENLANAHATASRPGGEPYARKTISFETVLDDAVGSGELRVGAIGRDHAPFRTELDPGHPAADERGYVKLPNVNPLIELADMREANRSYQTNLQVVRQARDLISMTIDLLKAS